MGDFRKKKNAADLRQKKVASVVLKHQPAIADSAIVTAAYVGQFRSALTLGELWRRWYSDHRVTFADVLPLVSGKLSAKLSPWKWSSPLGASKPHQTEPSLACLSPDQDAAWLTLRASRLTIARQKWQEVEHAVAWLQRCPWIDGIFITGGLAMNSVNIDDDIDFCIITKPHRLWITRLFVIFWAMAMHKRRSWQGEEPRSWCFNLWLDRQALALAPARQSPYEAYELLQAKPVFQRRGCLEAWYQQNQWAAQFAATWWSSLGYVDLEGSLNQSITLHQPVSSSKNILQVPGDFAEFLARLLQWWYMAAHRTIEQVTGGEAYFHPRPTRNILLNGWLQTATTYNVGTARQQVAELKKQFSG